MQIKFSETAVKQLKKIDKNTSKRIAKTNNPRNIGKALTGPLGNFWRYRVSDYRIICNIQDNNFVILVLKVANRNEVYRK